MALGCVLVCGTLKYSVQQDNIVSMYVTRLVVCLGDNPLVSKYELTIVNSLTKYHYCITSSGKLPWGCGNFTLELYLFQARKKNLNGKRLLRKPI